MMGMVWIIILCLNAAGVYAADVVGYCGGSVSIKCEYGVEYGQRAKYFCQGEKGDCREKVRTSTKNKWVTKDRFSLFDNATHYFIVGISELSPSDAGKYQCGVSVRGGEVVQSEVNLEVKDELSNCGMAVVKTAYFGEALNITCPYLDVHTHAAKYLCKSFRRQSCDYRVSARTDATWVHSDKVSLYDDRSRRVFSAVLSNLGRYDGGSYWCGVETGWGVGGEDGYKALIRKLQLTVAETRPTYSASTEPQTTEGPVVMTTTTSAPVYVTTELVATTTSESVHITPEPAATTVNAPMTTAEPLPPTTKTATTEEEVVMTTTTSEVLHVTTEPAATTVNAPMTTAEPLPPTTKTATTKEEDISSEPPDLLTSKAYNNKGQSSYLPDKVPVSTSVPIIIKNSSGLWHIVVYAIVALLILVIVCAVLLLIIRRTKRARTAGYSPSHVSMEALWTSTLLGSSVACPLNPSESASLDPNASEPRPPDATPDPEAGDSMGDAMGISMGNSMGNSMGDCMGDCMGESTIPLQPSSFEPKCPEVP